MNASPENEHFARLIVSIEPWLDQVVIIGGWAHRLYRLDARAQQLSYAPLMTLDTDVVVLSSLRAEKPNVRERLLANGFNEEILGDDQPPATHYRLSGAETGFYAEFLTPLTGSEHTRAGKRKATTRIAGVVSQRLRYVEILLNSPWSVSLGKSNGFPLPQATQVQIANPASFLAHKILVHSKRSRAKFAKDVLYIHDTLETFGGRIDDVHHEWVNRVKPALHKRSIEVVERGAKTLFGEMNDSVRQAALIAGGRKLSPDAILEVCNLGLKKVFL